MGRGFEGMKMSRIVKAILCLLSKSSWDYTFDYTFAVVFKGIRRQAFRDSGEKSANILKRRQKSKKVEE